MKCVHCGEDISSTTARKYCSERCKNLYVRPDGSTRRARSIKAVSKRRRNLKQLAVDYKGGKCSVCGYDRCNSCLDFHHIDPREKDFGISSKGLTRNWDAIKQELDKCVLLCRNCHGEVHAGITKLEEIPNG